MSRCVGKDNACMRYWMSVIYGHQFLAASRALRFADHVTKRKGGFGDKNEGGGGGGDEGENAHGFFFPTCSATIEGEGGKKREWSIQPSINLI